MKTSPQLDLFAEIVHSYNASNSGVLDNATLYHQVAERAGLPPEALEERVPVGQAGTPRNLLARRIRWFQQDLRKAGVIEHVEGERGVWQLTKDIGNGLREIDAGTSVVGFSTELGIAILGRCESVFTAFDAPVTLILTSPPFPLASPRAYGNVHESVYVDWICQTIEPVVRNLVLGGSICLNVSQDIFQTRSPSRSMYLERLTLALHDRLGLEMVDRLVWENPCKPPGPIQYASKQRVMLNTGYEPVLWMTNSPRHLRSDNRRVLMAHTEQHLKLIGQGGEQHDRISSDGAYRVKQGAYANPTEGRIPRNILKFPHNCADQRRYKQMAREQGLPVHGAPMPLALASFLIKLLSEPGDLIAEPFSGSQTIPKAAELLGRRWISTETIMQYVQGGSNRFVAQPGFENNLLLAA